MAEGGGFQPGERVKLKGFEESPEMAIVSPSNLIAPGDGSAMYRCLWSNARGAGILDLPSSMLVRISESSGDPK
jgi:uncharacterized protein YodC (DUF2158 family)